MRKIILITLVILLSGMVLADTASKEFTIVGRALNPRQAVLHYCEADEDYLKEIYTEKLPLRTQAEDIEEEIHIFKHYWNEIHTFEQYIDFNNPQNGRDHYIETTIKCSR